MLLRVVTEAVMTGTNSDARMTSVNPACSCCLRRGQQRAKDARARERGREGDKHAFPQQVNREERISDRQRLM